MKLYTSHRKGSEAPILVREGFSWGAALFGWLYFLFNRAFTVAALALAANLLLVCAGRFLGAQDAIIGLAVLQGLFGRDLLRWSLRMRGFSQGPVVAGDSADQALTRLLTERPDLLSAA